MVSSFDSKIFRLSLTNSKEFKEHLATQRHSIEDNKGMRSSTTPALERQLQFLSIADESSSSSDESPNSIEHSVLVSPTLEDMGNNMPSQFGLLGHLASQQYEGLVDPRVMLNTNTPFSAFICGLQGSGKSHTTSCIIGRKLDLHPLIACIK